MEWFELTGYLLTGGGAGLMAGLLGVGGGVIIVPALMLLFGLYALDSAWIPHQAVASSLASIVATGLAATWAHQRRGAVRWALVARLAPGLLLGAWLGAQLAGLVPESWLQRWFALFLLHAAWRLARPPPTRDADSAAPGGLELAVAGGGIGAFSALLGIGGGTLTVPYLARRGTPMRAAVATASACGVPIAVAGTVGFMIGGAPRGDLAPYSSGFVYWPAVLGIVLTSVPSAMLGARWAHRLPARQLARLFSLLLALVALRLLLG